MDEPQRERVLKPEPEGRYSNFMKAGYNAHEFVVEFGQMYQGSDWMTIHTRIVTTPAYAKAFEKVIAAALAEFERKYGPIQDREG